MRNQGDVTAVVEAAVETAGASAIAEGADTHTTMEEAETHSANPGKGGKTAIEVVAQAAGATSPARVTGASKLIVAGAGAAAVADAVEAGPEAGAGAGAGAVAEAVAGEAVWAQKTRIKLSKAAAGATLSDGETGSVARNTPSTAGHMA